MTLADGEKSEGDAPAAADQGAEPVSGLTAAPAAEQPAEAPDDRRRVQIAARLAVILPGGRSLVAVSGLDRALPRQGELRIGGKLCGFTAACWQDAEAGARAGLALIEAPLTEMAELCDAAGKVMGLLTPAPHFDVSPVPLADFVRAAGLNSRDVFDFLLRTLVADGAPEDRRAERDFAAGFMTAASETDGFIEILGIPECGGLFAQGWSMSLGAGRRRLAKLDGDLTTCEGEVTTFARDDILAPAQGFCFFSKDWREQDLATLESVFFEHEGRFRRLEVVRGSVLKLGEGPATQHVAHMLPRLEGTPGTLAAFRRICRPLYQGYDTLSGTPLPIAAAFDAIFQAPDGGLLAMGWMLDPLRRVERVILKSRDNLYAPLQEHWNPMARPDLNAGFAGDPRFARLLEGGDTMHGFLAYAPGRVDQVTDGEVYLELVLDDNTCLFRPVTVTRLDSRDRLPQILSAVQLSDPALDQIVEGTLAPFLAGLPARSRQRRAGALRPIPLSAPRAPDGVDRIAAVMPFRSIAQLQPIVALLGGTPEAAALDLVLVTSRAIASGLVERLGHMFRFYGLGGRLVLTSEQEGLSAQIEAGLAAAEGERVLLWTPSALPATPGWLARLTAEADALDLPGLISPTLVYEDGSVFFGGTGATEGNPSPLLGYPSDWLIRGGARPMPAGAAEIALIDRAALARAGGFSGRLFSDALAHRDLAERLHREGFGTWCSGAVDFWMLQDEAARSGDPYARLMEKVDAALIAGRKGELSA